MNFELLAFAILLLSFLGMAVVVVRKISVLAALPETKNQNAGLVSGASSAMRKINPLNNFSYEPILQKILSRFRILILKTDNKTFNLLKKLRVKAKIKRNLDGGYWQEIRKIKK